MERVLEVFDSAERVPGLFLQEGAREEHAVADQCGGQAEPGPAAKPDPVEQEEAQRDQAAAA